MDGCEGERRPEAAARKPWSAPTLTVTSIEESTNGTLLSTHADGGKKWS